MTTWGGSSRGTEEGNCKVVLFMPGLVFHRMQIHTGKISQFSLYYFTLNKCHLLLSFRIWSDGHIIVQRTTALIFFIFLIAHWNVSPFRVSFVQSWFLFKIKLRCRRSFSTLSLLCSFTIICCNVTLIFFNCHSNL